MHGESNRNVPFTYCMAYYEEYVQVVCFHFSFKPQFKKLYFKCVVFTFHSEYHPSVSCHTCHVHCHYLNVLSQHKCQMHLITHFDWSFESCYKCMYLLSRVVLSVMYPWNFNADPMLIQLWSLFKLKPLFLGLSHIYIDNKVSSGGGNQDQGHRDSGSGPGGRQKDSKSSSTSSFPLRNSLTPLTNPLAKYSSSSNNKGIDARKLTKVINKSKKKLHMLYCFYFGFYHHFRFLFRPNKF